MLEKKIIKSKIMNILLQEKILQETKNVYKFELRTFHFFNCIFRICNSSQKYLCIIPMDKSWL